MDVFLFGNRSLCLRWCFVVCITPYPFKFDTISRLQVAYVMFSFYVPTIFAIVLSFKCTLHVYCGALFFVWPSHLLWCFPSMCPTYMLELQHKVPMHMWIHILDPTHEQISRHAKVETYIQFLLSTIHWPSLRIPQNIFK